MRGRVSSRSLIWITASGRHTPTVGAAACLIDFSIGDVGDISIGDASDISIGDLHGVLSQKVSYVK
jgi:hypothetical protein